MFDLRQAVTDHGYTLPQAPLPVGNYHATTITQNLLVVSGQLPMQDGCLIYKGKIGQTLTLAQGRAAAELCALNLLSQIAGSLVNKEFIKILRLDGFIHCAETFTQHADVLNGASDLLAKILFEKAGHSRTVIGCSSLPLGAAVELASIIELR